MILVSEKKSHVTSLHVFFHTVRFSTIKSYTWGFFGASGGVFGFVKRSGLLNFTLCHQTYAQTASILTFLDILSTYLFLEK